MNREIKFRAWDKENKAIYNVYKLDWKNGTCLIGNGFNLGVKGVIVERSLDDVILLQYTGLKDKNGKEIYEGDILQNHIGKCMEVEWLNRDWTGYGMKGWGFLHLKEIKDHKLEIIGNIYDNANLLNDNE